MDRLAFIVNGSVKENINNTGASIEDGIMKYAKQYGVDPAEIAVTMHVSMVNDDGSTVDTGWLSDNKTTLKSINDNKKKSSREGNSFDNLEKAIDEIDKKYDSIEQKITNGEISIENKTAEMKAETFPTIEPVSLWATMGVSAANVGGGVLKTLAFIPDTVTGAVTNMVGIQDGGTHLMEGVTKLEDMAASEYGESAADMVNYRGIQEASGVLLTIAATGAVVAEVAPEGSAISNVLNKPLGAGSSPSPSYFAQQGGEAVDITEAVNAPKPASYVLKADPGPTPAKFVYKNGDFVEVVDGAEQVLHRSFSVSNAAVEFQAAGGNAVMESALSEGTAALQAQNAAFEAEAFAQAAASSGWTSPGSGYVLGEGVISVLMS